MTYAQLVEKLAAIGVHETERNLNNKISRGGFSAAFLVQCFGGNRMPYLAVGRCIAVAFSLLFLAGECHAQENAPAPPAQTQETNPRTRPPPGPPPVVQETAAEAEYYKASCEKPKDHDAADLCEQRRMAQAAADAVWWARLQTWLGGFGFVVVMATLILNGIATKAASLSASAATAQVSLSRQAMMQTERAFVHMAGLIIDRIANADVPDQVIGWEIGVRWTNFGKTPAQYCNLRTYGVRGPQQIDNTFTFPDQETNDPLRPTTIGPTDNLKSTQIIIDFETARQIHAGELRLD